MSPFTEVGGAISVGVDHATPKACAESAVNTVESTPTGIAA